LNGGVTYTVYRQPARATTRRIRIRRRRAAGLLVVIAAIAAALGYQSLASSSSPRSGSSPPTESSSPPTASSPPPAALPAQVLPGERPGGDGGPLGEADGAIPDGATVFDDEFPGVANLDPALLAALRRAATDARGDGVDFLVTSGWRSPEYQERLLQEAVSKYGSEQEAARWVATPETSPHVAGDAADLGSDASAWLSEHGAEYGLCQIYGNEPWHYELRSEAVHGSCPAMYADPTSDPRLQQ
jgi:zinc D-Ala-D-Ala carboxypeptidase